MDLCLLLLLVVLLGGCASGQGDTCTDSGCQCSGIDLSGFFSYPVTGIPDNTSPDNKKYSYDFSPCAPMMCSTGQDKNAALCQDDSTNPTSGSVSLGNIHNISWSVTSENEFTLTITGGTPAEGPHRPRESTITFQYVGNNVSQNEITYLGETADKTKITYKFGVQFNSAHAASGAGTQAGIVGIVLIILFIVGVLTYFIVGGLVMYFYKGARGVEVIPNYTFWRGLPILIKDGFMFTISPCHKVYTDKKGYQAL